MSQCLLASFPLPSLSYKHMATQIHTLSQTSWIVWVFGLSTGWTKNKRLFNSTAGAFINRQGIRVSWVSVSLSGLSTWRESGEPEETFGRNEQPANVTSCITDEYAFHLCGKGLRFYCSLCYCLHVNAWQSIKITCFAHFITLTEA